VLVSCPCALLATWPASPSGWALGVDTEENMRSNSSPQSAGESQTLHALSRSAASQTVTLHDVTASAVALATCRANRVGVMIAPSHCPGLLAPAIHRRVDCGCDGAQCGCGAA
ncbi:MAG: hypothetical protein V3S24_11785, partial [Candidatus Tectomicrobia bacterium]